MVQKWKTPSKFISVMDSKGSRRGLATDTDKAIFESADTLETQTFTFLRSADALQTRTIIISKIAGRPQATLSA